LHELLEPGVRALGFELILAEFVGEGHRHVLRVYIDGPDGVTVDDCAAVSHQLSAVLDVEEPFRGEYDLEVSSPGADRPLVTREHFARVIGRRVKVRLKQPRDGRRNFKGPLREVADDRIVIELDGELTELPMESIERARLVPEF
jgi:ribosome maturation factor RimP